MLFCDVLVAMRISNGDDGGHLARQCVGCGVDALQQFSKSLVDCRAVQPLDGRIRGTS